MLFAEGMSEYCGKEAVVKEQCEYKNGIKYRLDIDYEYWWWTDEMFEGLVSEENTTDQLIKDIAKVINKNNLGVSVKEEDGRLIIEPLNKEDNEDLPIDTPCMCGNSNNEIWSLRYYACKGKVFTNGYKFKDGYGTVGYDYIIPFDKFNPNKISESLKYNIVK